jgi:PPOX class probable F420-dependent enzyme
MPPLTPADADAFLAERHRGVLATLKADGRPQLSNVAYAVMDGEIWISTTADRAKTRNLRRDPRVSLYVSSGDFWTYLVVEGEARVSEVTREPGDEVGRALLDLYNTVSDEPHPDEEEFFARPGSFVVRPKRRSRLIHPPAALLWTSPSMPRRRGIPRAAL